MSGVIGIPGNEPWLVAGWGYRLVLERVMSRLTDPADLQELQEAIALQGLIFEQIPDDQALRLARTLFEVAADLQAELIGKDDSRDRSLAGYLVTLRSQLGDVYGLAD